MRARRPQPLLHALCAALLAAPLLTGVAADAASPAGNGSIGVPILTPPSDNATSTPAAADSVPPAATALANTTAPPPAAAAPSPAPAPADPAPVAQAEAAGLEAAGPETAESEAGADADSPLASGPEEEEELSEDDGGIVSADDAGAEDSDESEEDTADVEETDAREQGFGGRLPVVLESPTLIDAFNSEGDLIAVKRLSRFENRICSPRLACDSAVVSAMMLVASMAGAFIITHAASFLPDFRARDPHAEAMQLAETLSSTATATTQTSIYRPPSGEQYRWPYFFHFYRTRDKSRLRLGYSTVMWFPALLWAAVSFGTTYIVTPAEVDFRLSSPVYLAVTDAAEWGAVRFDGCNDILWRVDDELSPIYLRRTVRRCYDARRLASTEVPASRLPLAGDVASMLVTTDHVRIAVLYENGAMSTISRVSARIVDLAEHQPMPLDTLRGGVGGGRTDQFGMFLSSRVRPEALIPYFEAAMRQEKYAECGPPVFRYLGDDSATFSGRWVFTCSPERGAALGVDGLLLAVFLRHTEYRFDPRRDGETFEVFDPVRDLGAEVAEEVIEVMAVQDGLLIGQIGVIWCNWLCSVIVAVVAVALAAVMAAVVAFCPQFLPPL